AIARYPPVKCICMLILRVAPQDARPIVRYPLQERPPFPFPNFSCPYTVSDTLRFHNEKVRFCAGTDTGRMRRPDRGFNHARKGWGVFLKVTEREGLWAKVRNHVGVTVKHPVSPVT